MCTGKSLHVIDTYIVDSKQYQNYDQPEQQQVDNMASSWTLAAIRSAPPIRATKLDTFNIRVGGVNFIAPNDITGVAITNDNMTLLVDHFHSKVKLFAPDMKFLSAVPLPGKLLGKFLPDKPWDIAVANDNTAIVTNGNRNLVIVGICGGVLTIKKTEKLGFDVWGICRCNDKFVVTCPGTEPPSVKLIDQTGKAFWSASTDQNGEYLFKDPRYVCCYGDGEKSTVLVTDRLQNTLTLLNAETGAYTVQRHLKGNWDQRVVNIKRHLLGKEGLRGVTTDMEGNVFICSRGMGEVCVLLGGLVEERVLLKEKDGLRHNPCGIVYDKTENKLIISYRDNNNIDCFKLS